MIKKSIYITTLLFLGYNLFVSAIKFSVTPGHQWQSNLITAENYIYEHKNKKIVIVGSSLSVRLVDDLLPKNSYKLSFGGQSAFDGLDIIKKTDSQPGIVLIETNELFRSADKNFQNGLFMPIRYTLKKIFPALQEKNQPVCLLNTAVFWSLPKIKDLLVPGNEKKIIANGNSKANPPVENDIKKLMLDIFIADYSKPPLDSMVEEQKKKLIHYKEYFKEKGIEIILYEMPIDEKLANSKQMESVRKLICDVFPPNQYVFLQIQDCSKFSTEDGIHLDQTSALMYTSFLTDKINRYRSGTIKESQQKLCTEIPNDNKNSAL